MCLFRRCDETVIETKEYPSLVERVRTHLPEVEIQSVWISPEDYRHSRVDTIKCNACGRVRIEQRDV
jgi:hypothetical protein